MDNKISIFSYRIARDLIQNGFVVKDILPNTKVKGATVFIFEKGTSMNKYLKERWNIGE